MKIKHRLLLTHGVLVLLAVIIIIANITFLNLILKDSNFINYSGKLRATSYRLAQLSNAVMVTEDSSAKESYKKSLGDAIKLYESLYLSVSNGDSTLRISHVKNPYTINKLSKINEQWKQQYKPAFMAVYENKDKSALQFINSNIGNYVDNIDIMVTEYSTYSDKKVQEALIMNAALILVIVLTAAYSLVSTNNKIRKPMNVLVNELKELSLIDDNFQENYKSPLKDEIKEMTLYFTESMFDPLTMVFNRRAGLSKLQRIINYQNDVQANFSLCFIDINGLKQVNDFLGHKYGDELIIDSVKIIKETIRKEDFVIRLGGDEFLIVFMGLDENLSEKVWQQVLEKYNLINETEKRKYLISLSHGIIQYEAGHLKEIDMLIKSADEKMYEEKRRIKTDPSLNIIRA